MEGRTARFLQLEGCGGVVDGGVLKCVTLWSGYLGFLMKRDEDKSIMKEIEREIEEEDNGK